MVGNGNEFSAETPERLETVADILCDSLRRHGGRVVFQTYSPTGGVASLTRREIADQAAELAEMLHLRGIGPGSLVAAGISLLTLVPEEVRLEDAFMELTKGIVH